MRMRVPFVVLDEGPSCSSGSGHGVYKSTSCVHTLLAPRSKYVKQFVWCTYYLDKIISYNLLMGNDGLLHSRLIDF